MNMALFLDVVLQERIWGGTHLKDFGYTLPSHQIGECWGIAAHEHGTNIIKNGPHKGKTLKRLWEEKTGLFGEQHTKKFPLLTKILDANDDLSIQVHPNDDYAKKNENGEYGKSECWYIIDCDENAEIIYGHHAKDQQTLKYMIQNESWHQLFKTIKVKAGDFYYVPSGTVHAIGKGIRILETQQNSDTTYRIYDYNRKDANGNTRPLHIDKSIDVIHFDQLKKITPTIQKTTHAYIKTFIKNQYFTVRQIIINGTYNHKKESNYTLISIIEGKGIIIVNHQHFNIQKGDHFILTNEDQDILFQGKFDLIESYV